MAYTPKTWVCGETITAEDLNHLENGLADCCDGGGGAMIVGVSEESCGDDKFDKFRMVLDKTWNEIKTAYDNGLPIYVHMEVLEDGMVSYAQHSLSKLIQYNTGEPGDYEYVVDFEGEILFSDSADGVLHTSCSG